MKAKINVPARFDRITGFVPLLIILSVLSKNCPAQLSPPLCSVASPPGRTNVPGGRIITNVVLTWDAYTNAWFEVVGCTNLASPRWYHVTNVPVAHTNQVIPVTQRQEFFQVFTRYSGPITINH